MDPALAACVQLALAGPHAVPPPEPAARPSLTVSAFDRHLHAATTVDGRDRKQLERVCRYMLRPPFAHDAVQALEGGRVRILFKAPWRSGVAHADMNPDKFLARLCALVPPPGFHMTRYFGVFASHHHLRARIVPPVPVPAPELQLAFDLAGAANDASGEPADASPRPRRLGWASLLARVFAIDITICPQVRRAYAHPRGRLRPRRHRPRAPRCPRSAATTAAPSSGPAPLVRLLTARSSRRAR